MFDSSFRIQFLCVFCDLCPPAMFLWAGCPSCRSTNSVKALKEMGEWWRWALVSPDGVAPSRMVNVSASVNHPLHHKVRSSVLAPARPGCPGKKGRKTVVSVCVCVSSTRIIVICC